MKKSSTVISVFYTVCALLKVLDCYRDPNFTQKYFHVASNDLLILIFLIFVVSRIFGKIHLSGFVSKTSAFAVGPIILVLSVILSIINFHHEVNFIFSKTYLNIDQLYILGTFITLCGLISQTDKFLKAHYKKILLIASVSFILLFHFYGLLPFNARSEIVKEDQLIENVQVLVLLIGALYAAKIGTRIFKKKKLFAFLFFMLALVLLFVSGDETSWGQRIFNIKSPEVISKTNDQHELTFHNEHALAGYVPKAYMAVGIYGALAWIPYLFIDKKRKKTAGLFIPGGFLFLFFFSGFLYNFLAPLHIPTLGAWSEPAELMIYSGMMFYLITAYYFQASQSK